MPDAHLQPQEYLVDGAVTEIRVLVVGTHTGPMPMPTGEVPATGRRVETPMGIVSLTTRTGRSSRSTVTSIWRAWPLGSARPDRGSSDDEAVAREADRPVTGVALPIAVDPLTRLTGNAGGCRRWRSSPMAPRVRVPVAEGRGDRRRARRLRPAPPGVPGTNATSPMPCSLPSPRKTSSARVTPTCSRRCRRSPVPPWWSGPFGRGVRGRILSRCPRPRR